MAKYAKSRHHLHFDVDSLESIILKIVDRFDMKVVTYEDEESRMRTLLLTSGLALLGGFVGRKLQGGHVGTVVGGAVGAACGLGIAAVSMRNVWQDLNADLGELFKWVYKHLLKLNITDYYDIGIFLMHHISAEKALAKIIIKYFSKRLGKQVISSLM